jgi:hypothetical protein
MVLHIALELNICSKRCMFHGGHRAFSSPSTPGIKVRAREYAARESITRWRDCYGSEVMGRRHCLGCYWRSCLNWALKNMGGNIVTRILLLGRLFRGKPAGKIHQRFRFEIISQ